MKLSTKCYWLILILAAVLLLNGCGYKDIDKRFFVLAMGIDPGKHSDKKYRVSLKMAITRASKEKPTDAIIVTAEADTMGEAVRTIKTKVERELDFSHLKVVLVGDKVVKSGGNSGIFYWFTRRRDIQEVAWVAVGKPTAEHILHIMPKSERLPANALFLALGEDGSETPYIIPQYLFDFKKRLIERGLDPMMPIIEPDGKNLFQINSVGVGDKSKMKLVLDQEETKMLNFMLNMESKSAQKVVRGKHIYTIDTQKVKTSYKIMTPKGTHPYLVVNISLKGRLEETNRVIRNMELYKYEATAEKQLSNELKGLLVKLQKANVDPIGFGLRYRARHFNKNDWEQWQKIYPNITFKVNAKVQISDTGLVQ
ncbi:Ger(x)C family spore germination protein [Neobacillus dielmonensis]|uniref:Ger(x)C family spore germination protein n=1 Tax=Neobacillus dielmonensis TaxID=1347369 RepID=UPI0005AAA67F|nr:Ger(x)C family spore germination protein [Neobacillus dielmonensis]